MSNISTALLKHFAEPPTAPTAHSVAKVRFRELAELIDARFTEVEKTVALRKLLDARDAVGRLEEKPTVPIPRYQTNFAQ